MKAIASLNLLSVSILSLLVLVGIFVPNGKLVVALALLPFAIIDRCNAIFTLVALFLIRMSNTAIMGLDPFFATSAWIVSLAASTRIWCDFFFGQGSQISALTALTRALLLFVVTAVLLSGFGMSPAVSIMKIIGFYYIAGAIIAGITSSPFSRAKALLCVYAAWISVVLTSALTLFFPGIGYFRDGQGFQGSLNHPQLLGIFLAPLLAWLLYNIFVGRRPSTPQIFIAVIVIYMIYLTRARTGVASIILGAIIFLFLKRGAFVHLVKFTLKNNALRAGVALFIFLIPLLYSQFRDEVARYLFKSATVQSLDIAYEESRGFIIHQAIGNFVNHPVAGIGFGIANSETHDFNIKIDPLTGLPIGAPTEKANLIIAVLEETGVVGLAVFCVFLFLLLRLIANGSNVGLSWAALTAVCTNVSETTFFSMGGFGTFIWIICATSIVVAPGKHSLMMKCNSISLPPVDLELKIRRAIVS